MDPLSIATAAGTASKTLYSISTTLYTFINSAKKVDKSLGTFLDEVKAMIRALDAVQSVLEQPLILRTKAVIPGADHVWTSTASAIDDTQKTARALQELIHGLGKMDPSPNAFRKAIMQLKINFIVKDINEFRILCQSHFNSLNVSLHLVTMLIHCQSRDEVKIAAELHDIKRLVKNEQLDSSPGRLNTLNAKLPEELKNTNLSSHTQQLKRAAESVIDFASSVLESQSILGNRLAETNLDFFPDASQLLPEDSASNIGSSKQILESRKAEYANDGINKWLTGLKITETGSGTDSKGDAPEKWANGATSEHEGVSPQRSNRRDTLIAMSPSLPGYSSVGKSEKSGAEHQAPLGLSRTEGGRSYETLYEQWADIDDEGLEGESALHKAIATRDTSLVNHLLKWKAANIEQKDRDGDTPLLYAARYGSVAIVDSLLKSGADLEAKDRHGFTALDRATISDFVDIVKLLLESMAPTASKFMQDGAVLVRTATQRAAGTAASFGRYEVLELLLIAGARVNYRDDFGDSPLHEAAFRGHSECVRLLLNWGAPIEMENASGDTALELAFECGESEVAELLLRAGAKDRGRRERSPDALPFQLSMAMKMIHR